MEQVSGLHDQDAGSLERSVGIPDQSRGAPKQDAVASDETSPLGQKEHSPSENHLSDAQSTVPLLANADLAYPEISESRIDLDAPLLAAASLDSEIPPLPTNDPLQVEGKLSEERTVISRKPAAPPEAFFNAMPMSDMERILIGKQLDHFVLDEFVGGGGMGAVFRGRDLRLDRIVAIKVIPSAKRDAETLRRFRFEAQSAAKLDHPNIARVYFVGESENWNYIVFEYIDGVNLRETIERGGPLSVDDSVYYIRQVAEALEHARVREVVHRDIKPSNILVTPAGQAKLVDMGLARTTEMDRSSQDVTASGVTLGTFDYISPEQAKDPRDTDTRSDLYSLGCTWYYLLTGVPPFPEGTALQKLLRHGSEKPDDPRFVRHDLSNELVAILYKLMAKRPIDRYQTPVDLIADLQVLAEIEDLPRSQMIGNAVFAPTVAARSLLESAIPWLVGIAILLGSTVWLHSMDRLQGDLEFPEPTAFKKNRPIEPSMQEQPVQPLSSQGTNPSKLNSNSAGQVVDHSTDALKNREPTSVAPNAPFVSNEASNISSTLDSGSDRKDSVSSVGGSNPVNQAKEQVKEKERSRTIVVQNDSDPILDGTGTASTLEAALELALVNPQIEEIVIATPRLYVGPVRMPRRPLLIRAAEGIQPVFIWQPPPLYDERPEENRSSWFEMQNQAIELRGIHLKASLTGANANHPWCMVRVQPSSHLDLNDCIMTLENSTELGENEKSIFACAVPSKTSLESIDFAAEPRLQISIHDSIFRGEATWLKMPRCVRAKIDWNNGLAALSQRLIDVGGTDIASKTPVNLRLKLDHVTMALGVDFARIQLDAQYPNKICLNRESNDSALWLPRGASMIQIRGVEASEDLLGMCYLSGEDNAYDGGIDSIVDAVTRMGRVVYGFENIPNQMSSEQLPEPTIPWHRAPSSAKEFHHQSPSDYLIDGAFVPGLVAKDLPSVSNLAEGAMPTPFAN